MQNGGSGGGVESANWVAAPGPRVVYEGCASLFNSNSINMVRMLHNMHFRVSFNIRVSSKGYL